MQLSTFSHRAALAAVAVVLASTAGAYADDTADLAAELKALKTRIAELEAKNNENWLTEERATQIKSLVQEVIADARTRGNFSDGVNVGYKPGEGIFIGTTDKRTNISIGGFAQVRYTYAQHNAYNGRTISRQIDTTSGTPGSSDGSTAGRTTTRTRYVIDDPANASGFDIRRARITVGGNVFSEDITFKLEGDFYGSSTGAFTVTDAWIGYKFNDLFRIRAGSFKVPFAKTELVSDTSLSFMERPEVLAPFNPSRALGVSLFGDIVKDTLAYEINANDGQGTNTLRRVDTVQGDGTVSNNLDNRMSYYGRLQWAGSGSLRDFRDEADRRDNNSAFIWMLGGAVGMESQNSSVRAFPSPQGSTTVPGLSTNDSAGFTNYTLNGDLYRGTIDWSAKWQGWSFVTAAYFQQVNHNPGTSASLPTGYGTKDSFFQHAYYGQLSYMLMPKKLEVVGRAGFLLTEGGPNIGEYYSLGMNYYLFGQNAKIQSDVTYTPEAAYTDAAASTLQNTHNISFRVQLQLKF